MACSTTETMNPPGRRRGTGNRRGGGAGREAAVEGGNVIVATVGGTYPAYGRRGTASLCPYETPTIGDSTYCDGAWPGSGGGVNPITWTPAPLAMSIASITSPYVRFGAALMNISFATR